MNIHDIDKQAAALEEQMANLKRLRAAAEAEAKLQSLASAWLEGTEPTPLELVGRTLTLAIGEGGAWRLTLAPLAPQSPPPQAPQAPPARAKPVRTDALPEGIRTYTVLGQTYSGAAVGAEFVITHQDGTRIGSYPSLSAAARAACGDARIRSGKYIVRDGNWLVRSIGPDGTEVLTQATPPSVNGWDAWK